jgi:DNA repair exonuclease SbcCD ATPase subunit
MQIETVELKNVGPHRLLNVELSSGIVGIVGANGAGKSSLVNGIYAALTGDFKRFHVASKADVINNQAAKHEKSYIKLTGLHSGKPFELVRSLKPNEVTLKYGDSELETATQVNDALFKLMGLTPNVIERYVFVDQWEMFSFLDDTESVRAKAFQHLCGVESAIGLHKTCVAFRDKIAGRQTLDNSLDLESNILQLEETLATIQATKIKGLLKEDAAKAAEAKWQAFKDAGTLRAAKDKACYAADELQAAFLEKEKQFTQIDGKLKSANAWLEKHKKVCELAEQTVRDKNAQTAFEAKREEFQKIISLYEGQIEQLDADIAKQLSSKPIYLAEELPVKRNEKERMAAKAQELDAAVFSLSKGNKTICSSCLQELPASHKQKLVDERAELETRREKLDADLTQSSHFYRQLDATQKNRQERQVKLDNAKAELQGLSHVSVEVSDSQLENALNVLRSRKNAKEAVTATRPKYESLKADLDHLNGRIMQTRAQIDSNEKQLESLLLLAGDADDSLLQKLAEHREALLQKAKLASQYETTTQQLAKTKEMLAKVKATLAREVKIKALADVIDRVASAFHWSGLPKRVAQNNLVRLESHINEQLDLFNSPFTVEASNDLSFKVTFPGKPSVSARQLSGGQKVILAIAFRAALDRLFGHNIGMLFLDEPTAGLDADNVAYFHDAMQSWSANVGAQKQIVVITHVQDMTSAFDQMITIEK